MEVHVNIYTNLYTLIIMFLNCSFFFNLRFFKVIFPLLTGNIIALILKYLFE